MALFSKKTCAHCGKEAGMLTSYKLSDGNMICGDCLNLCSSLMKPEFLKLMSYDDFKEYLKYREENKKKLEDFNATNVFFDRIYVDMEKGQFIFAEPKFNCTQETLVEANLDVFDKNDLVFFRFIHTNKGVQEGVFGGKTAKIDVNLVIAFNSRWYPYAFNERVLKNDKQKVHTKIGIFKDTHTVNQNLTEADLDGYLLKCLAENHIEFPSNICGKLAKSATLEPYDIYLKKLFELEKLYAIKADELDLIIENIAPSPLVKMQIKKAYKK